MIIAIGGAHSGCGKTTVAERLLRGLQGRWAAIKYTRTAFYTSLRDETGDCPSDKDTGRLYSAGAVRVIRIQAPSEALNEPVCMALDMLDGYNGIIAEGNSLIEFLNPDVVIFVFGRDKARIKPSAKRILEKADIILGWEDKRIVCLKKPDKISGILRHLIEVLSDETAG